ncbi:rhomboid family intramembrane serine protease [Kocuria sp. p3-SID1433]|uniref:rhomboid family intramembrane serine protease n=1 Tax=unclassified Kocuria TaxID=2649579 RepID=UPI0021A67B32|nr:MULTISPECIES: rhomboid family intramembrane serine protease [unclassified Kocuria]MCT1603043.1 rhomboid family intramembrane serine protease [Kocuria sp. p3-SID1428]MCT2180561.1 rhomboid family intramembrane serine protease [Kocuria sp. p3-SID1433]
MTQGPHEPSGEPGSPRDHRSDSGPQLPQYGRMADPSQPAGQPSDPLQGASWQAGHPETLRTRAIPPAARTRRRGDAMTVTWVLIGINVAVYALQWLLSLMGVSPLVLLGLAPGYVWQTPWTVLTSGFAHSMTNPAHLLLNMYTLWIFGRMLESEIGRGRFLAVYLLSLLGGAAAVLLLSPAYTFTVGASGAVFGLFGAVLALALWGGRRYRENLSGILVLIGINTVFSLFFPGISWQGHLGGLVTGLVVMGVLLGVRGRGRRPRG